MFSSPSRSFKENDFCRLRQVIFGDHLFLHERLSCRESARLRYEEKDSRRLLKTAALSEQVQVSHWDLRLLRRRRDGRARDGDQQQTKIKNNGRRA